MSTRETKQWSEPSEAERRGIAGRIFSERLYCLAEEMIEVGMAALQAGQPENEIGDFMGVVQMMIDAEDLCETRLEEATARKLAKLKDVAEVETFLSDKDIAKGSRVIPGSRKGIDVLNEWCSQFQIPSFWTYAGKLAIRADEEEEPMKRVGKADKP